MDLREYYNLPEGTNASLSFIPSFFDTVDTPYPCPSSMENAFTYYKGISIPELDTSKVTNMSNMFNNCQKITSIPELDTSKVTNMNSMFYNCSKLTSIPELDTSKVTNMNNMFYYCTFTSLDLSNWDTSNVTDMGNMFANCIKLTSLSSIRADSLTIASYSTPFGTGNNTTLVDFGGFINLKSSWNGSYSVDKLTALSHQSLINILNALYDFTGNGVTPTSSQGKIKFGTTHLANLSDEEKAIATNKGWVLS